MVLLQSCLPLGLKAVREVVREATWKVFLAKRKALPCFQN